MHTKKRTHLRKKTVRIKNKKSYTPFLISNADYLTI